MLASFNRRETAERLRSAFFAATVSTVLCAGGTAARSLPDSVLTVGAAIAFSQDHNPRITQARAQIKITYGDRIIARSRFLPHVDLVYSARWKGSRDGGGSWSGADDDALDLTIRQRLLEFGPTRENEFERLRDEREALYAMEELVADICRDIRLAYFSLRIIRDQIHQRDSLLEVYTRKVTWAQTRHKTGVGLRNAVLAARLNRLEQLERLETLRFREYERMSRIRELLGVVYRAPLPALVSRPASLELEEDSCVARAVRSSTRIADARAEALLAKRRLRETGWEFAPDLHVHASIRNGSRSAGIEAGSERDNARRTWAIDAVGSERLIASDGTAAGITSYRDSGETYSAWLVLNLPVFSGMKRRGTLMKEGARYNQARAEAIGRTHDLERNVIQACARLRKSRARLEIQRERLEINRERYELNEMLFEKGKIGEYSFESFRKEFIQSQEHYFNQQFSVLEAEEDLRRLIRMFH